MSAWSDECEAAFTRRKTALMEVPVLAYPRFGHEFILETDAFGLGLGAVLTKRQRLNGGDLTTATKQPDPH